ncbi:MAG: hypothetical protein HY652_15085 [Acidobacteria bacterium]|nr:hypothetical protein [Acidobacteriota bacterium]
MKLLALTSSWILAALLVVPYCGWLFGCGCTWIWAGAVDRCNIHQPTVPHCPWCAHGKPGFSLAAVLIGVGQAVVIALMGRTSFWMRIGAGLATFLAVGMAAAYGFALYDHYPSFLR